MRIKNILLYTVLLCTCFSCTYLGQKKQTEQAKVIAEIGDKTLLLSDVKDIFPAGISGEDSLQLLRTYVNNWARKQLIAGMAEQYLSKEEKDVSQEIEDYRLSLLIFRYEQMYLEQRLNTNVSEAEIKKVYDESPRNFMLTKPIAKAFFLKIAEDVPQVKKVRQLYRSTRVDDQQELSQIGSVVAEKFTGFDEKWINAETLAAELPMDARQVEAEWTKGFINVNAGGYEYFVQLYDQKNSGEQAPLDYVRETIVGIINNQRKQDLLQDLEKSIFNQALNSNKLKIYIDK